MRWTALATLGDDTPSPKDGTPAADFGMRSDICTEDRKNGPKRQDVQICARHELGLRRGDYN